MKAVAGSDGGELVEIVCSTRSSRVSARDRKVAGALGARQRDGPRMELGVEHRTRPRSLPSRDPRHPPRRSARRARGVRSAMRRASWIAVTAFSSVYIGPPNAPACCPVRMATALGSASCATAARASGGALRRACCAASTSAIARRSPLLCLDPPDDVAPRLRSGRIAGVERCDSIEVVGVVAGERPDPGETADVDARSAGAFFEEDGAPAVRAGLDGHGVVLSQSLRKHVKVVCPTLTRIAAERIPVGVVSGARATLFARCAVELLRDVTGDARSRRS